MGARRRNGSPRRGRALSQTLCIETHIFTEIWRSRIATHNHGRLGFYKIPIARNHDPLHRDVVPVNLAKDILFPYATGNQLGVLRAKIQHQHTFTRDACGGRFGFIDKMTHPPTPLTAVFSGTPLPGNNDSPAGRHHAGPEGLRSISELYGSRSEFTSTCRARCLASRGCL